MRRTATSGPGRRAVLGHRDAGPPVLRFTPRAWLKWQYLCHAGPTEVAGFGRSAAHDPLLVEDVLVVRQRATPVTVGFDDAAVADLFDAMVDTGVPPDRFARVWLHTHPGASADPSVVDEDTFARAFGRCDWAVMAILSRTGRTSARLRFTAGPGGDIEVPVAVAWADWPYQAGHLASDLEVWRTEYDTLVEITKIMSANLVVFDDVFAEDPDLWRDWTDALDPNPEEDTHE